MLRWCLRRLWGLGLRLPEQSLPVFVAMMFGGTLGGNATLIGASANLVSVGTCATTAARSIS